MKLNGKLSEDRTNWVVRIISGCLLIQLFLTEQLWWSLDRSFPTVPVFSFLPTLNNFWWSELLPWGFVIALLGAIVFVDKKVVIWSVVLLATALIVLDVNRLQIWIYQWLSMLLVVVLLENWKQRKIVFQFMLIALYFWSGFNKLNFSYVTHSFPWLMEGFEITKVLAANPILALATAALEIVIAIGFLFRKTHKLSLGLAVGMHLLILLILGPWGHNWNYPVWPWNAAMIALVYILFFNENFTGFKSFWNIGLFPKIIFFIWGIFPLGNTLELWDEQLSFKMYSGTNPEGILSDASIAKNCFPDSLKVYYTRTLNEDAEMILIDEWALEEMYVPPYVSERTLKAIGKQWCGCLEDPEKGSLEILQVWRWSAVERPSKIFGCSELLEED